MKDDGGRDPRGRFAKGTPGNPKGRPRTREANGSIKDSYAEFGDEFVLVETGKRKVRMWRRHSLRHVLYLMAMKGDLGAIRLLEKLINDAVERRAYIEAGLLDIEQRLKANPFRVSDAEKLIHEIGKMKYPPGGADSIPLGPRIERKRRRRSG